MGVKSWIAVSLVGLSLVLPKTRGPVLHAAKKAGQVVSQPFRHPKKDSKAAGSHLYHFFKGDR